MGFKQHNNPFTRSGRGKVKSGICYSSAMESPLNYSPLKQDISPENQAELDRLMAGSEEGAPEDATGEEGTGGKNIGLLPSEHEDTWVYDGTDIGERINDYQERISFIHEDIWNQRPEGADLETPVEDSEGTPQQQKDLAILRAEIEKLRAQ